MVVEEAGCLELKSSVQDSMAYSFDACVAVSPLKTSHDSIKRLPVISSDHRLLGRLVALFQR